MQCKTTFNTNWLSVSFFNQNDTNTKHCCFKTAKIVIASGRIRQKKDGKLFMKLCLHFAFKKWHFAITYFLNNYFFSNFNKISKNCSTVFFVCILIRFSHLHLFQISPMTRNSTLNKAEINAYTDCVDFFLSWVNEAFLQRSPSGKTEQRN